MNSERITELKQEVENLTQQLKEKKQELSEANTPTEDEIKAFKDTL